MNIILDVLKGFGSFLLVGGGITLAGMAVAGLLALVLRWWFEWRQK